MIGEISNSEATCDVDPFSREYLSNPYPEHERLRAAGPVIKLKDYDAWGMARYRDVAQAMVDWETYISSAGVGLTDLRREKNKVLPK